MTKCPICHEKWMEVLMDSDDRCPECAESMRRCEGREQALTLLGGGLIAVVVVAVLLVRHFSG